MSAALVEFLKARLDEDERQLQTVMDAITVSQWQLWTGGGTTVLMHPHRARMELKAKRTTVEDFERTWRDHRENEDAVMGIWAMALKTTLHRMAEAYDKHPDYNEAWRT